MFGKRIISNLKLGPSPKLLMGEG